MVPQEENFAEKQEVTQQKLKWYGAGGSKMPRLQR